MFYILGWIFFGILVGLVAKYFHPGKEPVGFLPTLVAGVAGSAIGGIANYFISGSFEFRPAGFVMSVIGGVVFFVLLKWLSSKNAK